MASMMGMKQKENEAVWCICVGKEVWYNQERNITPLLVSTSAAT